MKTSIAFALAAAFSLAAAQSVDPAPSPTESYGCEAHGDHWHCKGPVTVTTAPTVAAPIAPTTTAAVVTSTAAPDDHDDHDDHTDHTDLPASTSASAEPSPAESIGCEVHGDHWHCDGPRETTSAAAAITSAPASTLSTTAAAAANSTSTSASSPTFTGAANTRNAGLGLVGGLLILSFAL